jgi:2,5-diketo-D-gluconate reductase B
MPAIGYGTMELPQRRAELVAYAIQSGYRLINTARKYGTEERVGEGIRATGIAREELWVTAKVTELDAREADFLRSAETSLKTMQLDYIASRREISLHVRLRGGPGSSHILRKILYSPMR